MSSLKRSKPEEQDAILRRLQELSSSRLEMDEKDEVSRCKSPLPNSSPSSDQTSDHTREEQETVETGSDMLKLKISIPDLKITPEIDDDSHSISSSASSSVKVPANKQPTTKVLLQSLPASPISRRLCSPHLSPRLSSPRSPSPRQPSPNPSPPSQPSPYSPSPRSPPPRQHSPHLSPRPLSPHLSSPHLSSPHQPSPRQPSPRQLSPHPSPPPRFKGCSPKAFRRFEFWPDSLSPASSSPTSPSRKFFRLPGSPSPFAGDVRRGSEPFLEVGSQSHNEGDEVTKSKSQSRIADKRWEKLRSVLVAMKEEPFDVDSITKFSPLATPSSPKEHASDVEEELNELKLKLSALRTKVELKEHQLQEALDERSAALAYLRDKQLLPQDRNRNELALHYYKNGPTSRYYKNGATSCDGIQTDRDEKKTGSDDVCGGHCHALYTHQLEVLSRESSTKEEVLAVLGQALREWTRERSFLDNLMTLALANAPWMVDQVVGKGDRNPEFADTDTDPELSDEDLCDEVWC